MNRRALALLSGGLDSTLAVKLILEQGISVEAVNFITLFCTCTKKSSCCLEAGRVATKFGIKLKVFNISKEYLELVKHPKFGYGRGMNPCLDCRIFMFKKAGKYMKEIGASFLVTGEVLGERPMSQRRDAIKLIERESGLEGLILRPLSAKLLPPTLPEKIGIVDREKLLGFSGRSRKPQIKLADKYGIRDYPCPAGGCLLTDQGFAKRFQDLLKHSDLTLNDVQLLKLGRHFRLSESCKVVVGRNELENKKLLTLAKEGDLRFKAADFVGPITIGRGRFGEDEIKIASSITARYSDGRWRDEIRVSYGRMGSGREDTLTVSPIDEREIEHLRI
jgi:tRNA U34 2-thiouridine synthase MnmA/TrmU